jgi:hypothetical protein
MTEEDIWALSRDRDEEAFARRMAEKYVLHDRHVHDWDRRLFEKEVARLVFSVLGLGIWIVLCGFFLGLAHRYGFRVTVWQSVGGLVLIESLILLFVESKVPEAITRTFLLNLLQGFLFCLLLGGLCGSPVAGVVYFFAR